MRVLHAVILAVSGLVLAAGPEGRAALAFRANQDPPPQPETFTLTARYRKGDKITRESTSKMEMSVTVKTDIGGEPRDIESEREGESREKYTTHILGVTEKGEVERELREYTLSESRQKGRQSSGDVEQEMPERKETQPLEGKTFEITRSEDGARVVMKGGDEKEMPRGALKRIRPHHGMEVILPDRPVGKGNTWTVDGKKLRDWTEKFGQQPQVAEVTGAIECTLKEVTTVDGERIATILMDVNLEISWDLGKAMAEEKDEDEEEGPKPKVRGEVTIKLRKGKGEYRFNLDDGLPMRMEMSGRFELEVSQEFGDNEVKGKGQGTVEAIEEWKLEERP